MDNPSPEQKNQVAQTPQPEPLKPRAEVDASAPAAAAPAAAGATKAPKKRLSYRPNHKATFIGVAAVALILAINAGILAFVLKSQAKTNSLVNGQVSISPDVLNQLGVNRSSLGSSGVVLNVGPDAKFNGKVDVAGAVNISGQLSLNSTFSAANASLTQLQAGNTQLTKLNVNSDSTLSNLNLRDGLIVAGASHLQGATTFSQLVTINNNLSVAGNVAVGGTLTVTNFSARSLTSSSTLSIGGHVITAGRAPGVGPGGPALGSNGTVSISGNDAAGRIAINIGTSASSGTLVNVAFHSQYSGSPRVVISPIGVAGEFYLTSVSAAGFSVAVGSSLPPGGYAIDYIVEQ